MREGQSLTNQYNQAADIIKTAILQSQHEAAKSVNRVQLLLYYNIGKFLSPKRVRVCGEQMPYNPLATNYVRSFQD